MEKEVFKEALLQVMEAKDHWAWSSFTSGRVAANLLHIHLEQEYAVYVRDFPVLVARAYVNCPIAEVRRELIENVYEEETGGLAAQKPHPELFLEYPRGLGMDLTRFESVNLLPAAKAYRDFLDAVTLANDWAPAAAVTTLFLEGTKYDRSVLDPNSPPRPQTPLEEHPLVKHYGLAIEHLALTKAHRGVEGDHRESAWEIILHHASAAQRMPCVDAMQGALEHWLAYRDSVAIACGLTPSEPLNKN